MAQGSLQLIVGLGNPGVEYQRTRHNAGFWFVDALAGRAGAHFARAARHQCELARARVADRELWLMKPTTFMNRSGAAVQSLIAFHRWSPAECLVVHDEIDLPPGVARFKWGGGHGGHNGLRDIIATIGADFWRLRVGVGHPGSKEEVVGAVLGRASSDEQRLIDDAVAKGLDGLERFLRDGAQPAMNWLHSATVPAPESGAAGE